MPVSIMASERRYVSKLSGSVSERRLTEFSDCPLPPIGPIPRILLLCARETLQDEQVALVRGLCAEVDDWDAFVAQVEFRLIVPLVYRHLSNLVPDAVPTQVVERLKTSARRVMLANLAKISVHHRLTRDVLGPLQVPHLYFKGPSLAYRYYREPVLRQFRDIDLLIPRREMIRVGKRLREVGFRSYQNSLYATDDGLKFRQRFVGMMDWVSPEGVLVEMPSSLDDWGRLPADEVIARAEFVNLGNLEVPVISGKDFFGYMCKHHSRHHWARLHWVADLNAILAHPEFELDRARKWAQERGFERTVEAAIAIHHAVGELEPWNANFVDPFARELFRQCLINLEGDFKQELHLRGVFPATDIDIAPARRLRRHWIKRNLGRFRPHGDEFVQCPLPARWHWFYYLLRPFLWVSHKLSSRRTAEHDGHSEHGA